MAAQRGNRRRTAWAGILAAAALASGCATPYDVRDELRERSADALPARETAILFLIDGLSSSMLITALQNQRAPNLLAFFGGPNGNLAWPATKGSAPSGLLPLARASFPTLTYPNLASILTGEPPSRHGIVGNQLFLASGEILSLEDHRAWEELPRLLRAPLVFERLTRRSETSVSLSYPFRRGSTARVRNNIQAGGAYAAGEYREVDLLTLTELRMLLREPFSRWPRFLFVHLIGVDGYAHRLGPGSAEVQRHLHELDAEFAFVFERLREAHSAGHRVRAALSSDHGFASTGNTIDLRSRNAKGARTLTDNRAATVYLRGSRTVRVVAEAARELSSTPGIEWCAARGPKGIELYRDGRRAGALETDGRVCEGGGQAVRLAIAGGSPRPFACDEDDFGVDPKAAVAVSLFDRFRADDRPDLALVAQEGWDFADGYRGNHGGLTSEELYVPLLTWNMPAIPQGSPTRLLLRRFGL